MSHRLRHFAVLVLLVSPVLISLTAPTAQARPASATSGLAARVAAAMRGSTVRHIDYRVHVAGVGTVSHNATRTSSPASNQKLLTTITLLDLVGPEFRYTTTISGTTAIATNGSLHGDLVLKANGDPTLTIADLRVLASRLHAKGLRHVTGRLIVDDTRYSHLTRVSGWKHSFVPVETGTVDAFSVDGNQWRGGKSFELDPTIDNAALWRHELKKSHITVAGRTTIERAPSQLTRLATHHSPHLGAIVEDTLTNSVNFYAEMMLREAGAQRSGHGTPATGVAAERSVAAALGLPLGTVHDGSGLSDTDRESPAMLMRWLTTLKTLAFAGTVYDGLPISCQTGTLENRMCGPNVIGKVHAKTGSIDHVAALSGYTRTNSGRDVMFSFLLSGFKDRNFSRVLDHLDAAIAVIVRTG